MKRVLTVFLLILVPYILTACTIWQSPKDNGTNIKTFSDKNSPQVVKLDSFWNKYTNNEFKYSIEFPYQTYHQNGSCYYVPSENSYAPKYAPIPIKVNEKESDTYIYIEYRYHLFNPELLNKDKNETSLTTQISPSPMYTNCEMSTVSNEELSEKIVSDKYGWRLHAFNVDNMDTIDKEIKKEYGLGCKLEVLKPTNKPQEFDVIVGYNGDIEDPVEIKEKNECLVNYSYFFKYSEKSKTAVSIKMGTSFIFLNDPNTIEKLNEPYDESMLKSFEFID